MPDTVNGDTEKLAQGTEAQVRGSEAEGVKDASPASSEQADSSEKSAEGEKPQSMLSAVLGALKDGKEGSPASDTAGDKPDAAATQDTKPEDQPLGPITEEEFKQYGARAQRRIRDLVGHVNAYRQQLEAFGPKAEVFDKMDSFIREKGLSEKDVEFTFAIMAAVKEDKPEALEALRTIVNAMEQRMGVQLPSDLAEEVRLGLITPQRAQELSVARRTAEREARTREQVVERTESQRAAEQHSQLVGGVHQAVASWEQQQAAKDPDWSRKSPRLMEKIELAFVRNAAQIRTPRDAIALAEHVRKQVDDEFRALVPRPKPIRPLTGGTSSPKAPGAPSNMLELVRSVVGG